MRLWKINLDTFSQSRKDRKDTQSFPESPLANLGELCVFARNLLNVRAVMFLLVTAICVGESAMDVFGPEVRRVGGRLACLCKTCVETVGTCPMLQCHYSSPARQRISQMAAAGVSDDKIVDTFVKENGIEALSVPPAEGFNSMVWIMPWLAGALGLGGIAWYVKHHSKPRPLEALPAGALEHLHELDDFEKDLAEHD